MIKATIPLVLLAATVAQPAHATGSINSTQLTETPLVLKVTNSQGHLLDFSQTDRQIVGIWIEKPQEFAKSFQIKPFEANPQALSINAIVGGSSSARVNIISVDSEGNQQIHPIRIIREATRQTVTRLRSSQSIAATQSSAALAKGVEIAASMGFIEDPELRSRVEQLKMAAQQGQDPMEAAEAAGLSSQFINRLLTLSSQNL